MAATKSAGETSFHRIIAAGLNADETHALLATRYRYNSAKVINHHYRPPCLQKIASQMRFNWRFSPVKFNRRINCSLVLTVLPETHFSLTAGYMADLTGS